jgi:hypothetical protein
MLKIDIFVFCHTSREFRKIIFHTCALFSLKYIIYLLYIYIYIYLLKKMFVLTKNAFVVQNCNLFFYTL